jgi:nitrate reductase NapE component
VTGVEYSYAAGKRKEQQEMKWFGVVITGLFSITSIAGYALVGYILFVVARWALSLF